MGIISKMLGFTSEMMNDGNGNIIDLNDFCHKIEIVSYHRLAMEIAIDLIGNAVARVDWNEFKNNKQQATLRTSRLNGQPNQLQTSTEFYKQLVRTLFLKNEVLILEIDNELYIADGFQRTLTDFKTAKYTAVTINGKEAPKKVYNMQESIYLTYADTNIRAYLESYMTLLNDLASTASTAYKNNKTRRFVLGSDHIRSNLTEVQQNFNKMMEQQLASFISSSKASAIYAKPKNAELVDMSDKNFMMINDSRGIITDIFTTVANTFHIPPEYMLGGALNQVIVDNFLINAVYPIVDLFKEGFNNQQFTELERRNGTLVKPDTTKSRIVDLKTIGTFIAQVFPTGALTLNDIVTKYLQLDELPDEIGNTRVITKNYSELDQFINGETHDEQLGTELTIENEEQESETKEPTLLSKFLGGK